MHFEYIHSPYRETSYKSYKFYSMDRRDAVKKLMIASGTVISLPFWMTGCDIGSDTSVHLSSFSSIVQQILAAVTDAFIPAGNETGALAVGVDKFLQKLFDDCYDKEIGDNIKKQLQSLNAMAKKKYERSFATCSQFQRQELLVAISGSVNKEEKDFFTLVRSETIRGFATSKEVMEKYLNYQIAPGHYHGCVDLKI